MNIGPNTSIGDNVVIENASVENSIIMDGATISCQQTIQDSLIGRNVEISKNDEQQKQGLRFILGDQSKVQLMIQENSITYPLLIIIMSKPGWIEEPLYNKIKQLIPLPCVDLLVTHNGRLLLMNRKNNPAKGLWFTPGGRINKNESIRHIFS